MWAHRCEKIIEKHFETLETRGILYKAKRDRSGNRRNHVEEILKVLSTPYFKLICFLVDSTDFFVGASSKNIYYLFLTNKSISIAFYFHLKWKIDLMFVET